MSFGVFDMRKENAQSEAKATAHGGEWARRCARCSKPCKQAGNVTVVSCDKYERAASANPTS